MSTLTPELEAKIKTFLGLWHENGRTLFERTYHSLDYDSYYPKTMTVRRRWVALDKGTGGVFLLDPITEEVYTIKAYGVPNRRVGTLDSLIDAYRQPLVKQYEYA